MEASLKSVTAALGTLRVGAADSEERLHEQAAEALTKQGLTSAVIFAQRFFEAFQKVAQVALGKPSK